MENSLKYILANGYKKDMMNFLAENPKAFEEAIQLSLTDEQPYAWRSAWLLVNCMKNNDERIHAHLDKIIGFIPHCSDSQARDFIRILLKMDLPENVEGKLFDFCLTTWENTKKQPAFRMNAFKMLLKIVDKHPELSNEIQHWVQPQYLDSLTVGVRHSMNKILKERKIVS